jgi:hypothetical protein
MVVDYLMKMKMEEERGKRKMRRPTGYGTILTNERNYVKEYDDFIKSKQLRPSQYTWNLFLDRYKDETKELRNENFIDYIRHKGLGHHLSESQIVEQNRESQGYNAMGLMSGLAPVAMTLGAMVGANYLINRGIDNGRHRAEHAWHQHLKENPQFLARQQALSGENSHYEASPPAHIGSESNIVPQHLNYGEASKIYTGGLSRSSSEEDDYYLFDSRKNPSFPTPQELERLQQQKEYYMGDTGSYL